MTESRFYPIQAFFYSSTRSSSISFSFNSLSCHQPLSDHRSIFISESPSFETPTFLESHLYRGKRKKSPSGKEKWSRWV